MLRFVCVLTMIPVASAQSTLNFEAMPDGSEPTEGLDITTQFAGSPHYVSFERYIGASPTDVNPTIFAANIAKIGGDPMAPANGRTAFEGERESSPCHANSSEVRHDMPREDAYAEATDPRTGEGCYFLTDDGLLPNQSAINQDLVVRYSVPVTAASGWLLDVDNNELFHVIPRDEFGIEIPGLRLSFDGHDYLNGDAVQWMFESVVPIWSIYIDQDFETRPGQTRGIAFDEFSPNTSCPDLVEFYGQGVAGFQGRIPTLTVNCPRVGQPFRIQVHNGMPFAHGCFVVGAGRFDYPMPGGRLLVRPPMIAIDAHNLDLNGSRVIEIPSLDLSLLGRTFNAQAAYSDPFGPDGFTYTAGVEFTVSP